MAPAYKLTYFSVPGAAEPIRFLFSYGGLEFEDNRILREDWPALKPSTPFGQIPILEKDGKVVAQSLAIARYVAKQVKLVGKDDWENLEIDAVIDTINDLRTKFGLYRHETNPEKKETLKQTTFKETIPYYFSRFEAAAGKNNEYLAAGKLTWADVYFVAHLDAVEEDLLVGYPNLIKIRTNVMAIPNIKKWVETRPKAVK